MTLNPKSPKDDPSNPNPRSIAPRWRWWRSRSSSPRRFYTVKAGQTNKKPANPACAAAKSRVGALRNLAKGDVAGFVVSKDPDEMQQLVFNGPEGAPVELSAFKGKSLLLNVWATWCVPCRQEMPALDHLQQRLGSDKFEVVAVNVDTSRLERPKAFLAENGVKNLKFYADPKFDIFVRLKQTGELLGLPTTFLIDPAGCKLGELSGPAAWDSPEALALVRSAIGAAP